MAGLAALRAVGRGSLKWPNDLIVDELKVGGILVERSDDVVVAGFGLNLWWPDPPEGVGSIERDDPGLDRHAEIGALWAAELLHLVDLDGWPIDDYRASCVTLGRRITWDPDGSGIAVDVTANGELVVHDDSGRHTIASGGIRHVRSW
jgi:BirA family biotin operon repressor/biotin-[acetyl-CoA-carboxylase] ligase